MKVSEYRVPDRSEKQIESLEVRGRLSMDFWRRLSNARTRFIVHSAADSNGEAAWHVLKISPKVHHERDVDVKVSAR